MIRSEKAVSEVVGMVLVLGIMMLVIGIIMLGAVPMIESGKSRAKMDVAMNSFLSLQNDIEEVVRGPIWVKDPYSVTNISRLGPSRDTEFQLMGGSLSVITNATAPKAPKFMLLNITNLTNHRRDNITIAGGITYTADREEIAYENGAVIRKYETGYPIIFSNPLITIYNTLDNTTEKNSNISISIHAINITGRLSSVGGDGKAWIETRPRNYSQIIPPNSTPNANQTNITIYSKYPEAWKVFFEAKLKDAGLNRSNKTTRIGYNISDVSSGYPLEIQIYGTSANKNNSDIFLSVYESELDIMVR